MLSRLSKILLHSESEIDQHRYHNGYYREDYESEGHAHGAEDYKRADDLDSCDEKLFGTVVREFGDVEKVGGDTGHKRTDLGVVIIRERELLQVGEEILPHIGLDLGSHNMTHGGHIVVCGGVDYSENYVDYGAF